MTQREFAETTTEYREELAKEIAKTITIRSYKDGCSYDEARPTTLVEENIIFNLVMAAFGAYGYRAEGNVDSILDMAEMSLHRFIPEANAYDSIYIPFKKAVGIW